jgi:hypothetical protein
MPAPQRQASARQIVSKPSRSRARAPGSRQTLHRELHHAIRNGHARHAAFSPLAAPSARNTRRVWASGVVLRCLLLIVDHMRPWRATPLLAWSGDGWAGWLADERRRKRSDAGKRAAPPQLPVRPRRCQTPQAQRSDHDLPAPSTQRSDAALGGAVAHASVPTGATTTREVT